MARGDLCFAWFQHPIFKTRLQSGIFICSAGRDGDPNNHTLILFGRLGFADFGVFFLFSA